MDVFEAIKNRRSIRRYKPDAIPDHVIREVMEAALLAPSWANSQCWRFIVVKDAQMRYALAMTSPVNRGVQAIKQAPAAIVACAKLGVAGIKNGMASTDKGEYWFMFDVALAMQNMVLRAWSLGLGTVYCGLFDTKKVAELLKIPEDYSVVAMTPLGYPESDVEISPRKEMKEVVFSELFGKPL